MRDAVDGAAGPDDAAAVDPVNIISGQEVFIEGDGVFIVRMLIILRYYHDIIGDQGIAVGIGRRGPVCGIYPVNVERHAVLAGQAGKHFYQFFHFIIIGTAGGILVDDDSVIVHQFNIHVHVVDTEEGRAQHNGVEGAIFVEYFRNPPSGQSPILYQDKFRAESPAPAVEQPVTAGMGQVDAIIFDVPDFRQPFGDHIVLRPGAVVIPFIHGPVPRFQPPQPPGGVIPDPDRIGGLDHKFHRIDGRYALPQQITSAGTRLSVAGTDDVSFGNSYDMTDNLGEDAVVSPPAENHRFRLLPLGDRPAGFVGGRCGIVGVRQGQPKFMRREIAG